MRLNVSNEDQYCFKLPQGTLCVFQDQKDEKFRAFMRLLQRTAESTRTHTHASPQRATSTTFDKRMANLLQIHFPLKREYSLSLHVIESFSNTTSDGIPAIRTDVRSKLVPIQEIVRSLASTASHDDSVLDQKISFKWCHSPANHHAWVKVRSIDSQDRLLN